MYEKLKELRYDYWKCKMEYEKAPSFDKAIAFAGYDKSYYAVAKFLKEFNIELSLYDEKDIFQKAYREVYND